MIVLREHLDLPFALYGHSLGGLLAFELTRQLQLEGLETPRALFVGASAPPVLGLLHPQIHHLPDHSFVEVVQDRYAGIPAPILGEPELMALFLPALKADFAAHETYDRSRVYRVCCPITAFAGCDDPVVQPALMEEWSRHTRADFHLNAVPGDHFFLTQSRDTVLSMIRCSLLGRQSCVSHGPEQPMLCRG